MLCLFMAGHAHIRLGKVHAPLELRCMQMKWWRGAGGGMAAAAHVEVGVPNPRRERPTDHTNGASVGPPTRVTS
jgi:hypothetical protein